MANCFSLQLKGESEEAALMVKTCNPAIDASAGVGGQSGFWVYPPFVMGGLCLLVVGMAKCWLLSFEIQELLSLSC